MTFTAHHPNWISGVLKVRTNLEKKERTPCTLAKSKQKKVGVLPIRIVKSVSSVGPSSKRKTLILMFLAL